MPTDKPRITLMVPPEILKRIEDYRFDNRFPSQSAAILDLIVRSLDTPRDKKEN